MPLVDLLGKRARTASGVEVATPTVRSFFRALEVFGAEIGIVREAARGVPDGIGVEIALAMFLATPEDGRLEYVTGSGNPEVAQAVAAFVAPLAGRIDGLLGTPGAEAEESDDVESGVLLVLGCAERFHIDPVAVMDWPLGLFLDAIQAFSRPPKQPESDAAAQAIHGSIFPTITAAEAGGDSTAVA